MLLSLYDFENVCKLKFVPILLPWECISLYSYTAPYFLSPVHSPSPALMEVYFSPPFLCEALVWLSFPCSLRTPVIVGLISVAGSIALNGDSGLNLGSGAIGVDPCMATELHWENIKATLKIICLVRSSNCSAWVHTLEMTTCCPGTESGVGLSRIIPF